MGSLSVRGVDNQLSVLLKEKVGLANKSVNQFVLEMLRRHVGFEKPKRYTAQSGLRRKSIRLRCLMPLWSAPKMVSMLITYLG